MDNPVRYVSASKRSHDLVWDRLSGDTFTLEAFMADRDYGEVVRDGRLAAELELLDGMSRFVCPHCKGAMGIRSKAIRARSEIRFYFRSEEHTSELQSLMRISYAVFCLKKKTTNNDENTYRYHKLANTTLR